MIPARLAKIGGDLSLRWGRTLLTLIGLALGLYGVGAVLVSYLVLSNDLEANYTRTDPPNIVLDSDALDADALHAIATAPGVAAIERRDLVSARVETVPGRWMGMLLFVVDDFSRMQVAKFYPEEGAWPPPDGGILMERDGRFFLHAPLGTPLRLRLASGETVNANLAGLAFDPGQAPARMELVTYGYVARSTLEQWRAPLQRSRLLIRTTPTNGTVAQEPGLIARLHGVRPAADTGVGHARRTATQLQALLAQRGVAVRGVSVSEVPKHPHQFQLDSILALLAGLAAVSFAMCAVLVVNLIDALMAHEQRAIGVMKALGGRSPQIAVDYLAAMGLLGLVAGLASLPFALRTGRAIADFEAMALNFKLTSRAGPPWLIACVLAVAVLIPMLVATLRILRTVRMPVRDALARVAPTQKTPFADGFGRLLSPLPLWPRMALLALARKPRRALLTASILALGLVFFATGLNMRSSLLETVTEVLSSRPHDLEVTFRDAYPVAELDAWVRAMPGVRDAEFWSATSAQLLRDGEPDGNAVALSGVPAGSKALRPNVIAGTWVDGAAEDGIVASQRLLAEHHGLRVGERYRLEVDGRQADVRLVGVVKEFGPAQMYASAPLVAKLLQRDGAANRMYVTLDQADFAAQRKASGKIEESLVDSPWQIAQVQTSRRLQAVIEGHLDVIAALLLIIAAMALFVGTLGLASSISVSVVERYREVGVLKAIGGRGGTIARLFAYEALGIGLIGWALAMLAAPWLSRSLSASFGSMIVGYPFGYRAADYVALATLAVAVLSALAAGAIPMRNVLGTTAYRALRCE